MDTPISSNAAPLAQTGGMATMQRMPGLAGGAERVHAAAGDSTKAARKASEQQSAASLDQVKEAAGQIQDFIKTVAQNLQFDIDQDSGRIIAKLIDKGTSEVIRQIPSEEVLDIAKALDSMKGLLISRKA